MSQTLGVVWKMYNNFLVIIVVCIIAYLVIGAIVVEVKARRKIKRLKRRRNVRRIERENREKCEDERELHMETLSQS
jgi:uncharacterized protein (DUF2062 family)